MPKPTMRVDTPVKKYGNLAARVESYKKAQFVHVCPDPAGAPWADGEIVLTVKEARAYGEGLLALADFAEATSK